MEEKPIIEENFDITTPSKKEPSRTYNINYVMTLTLVSAIGGFLFGYDTGVIGGANLYVSFDPSGKLISNTEQEQVVSIAVLGAAVGSLFGGFFADNKGRKPVILVADVFFTVGALLMMIAPTVFILMLGRFLVGIGVGLAAMVNPIYLAETAPTSIRGSIVTINIIFVTTGQLLAYLICLACGSNWRLMLGLAGVPSILQFILMIFTPESPRYLMKVGKVDEAKVILAKILNCDIPEGKKEFDLEIHQIEEFLRIEMRSVDYISLLKELFSVYIRIAILGITLQIIQQFSGINTAMYYGPEIMKQAGFHDPNNKQWTLIASLPLAFVNAIGTYISLCFVDSMGRRYIMLRVLPGCAAGMFGLAISMYLINNAYTVGKVLSLLSILVYLAFFSVGMGATPWTVNSEIYPLHLRGLGNSLSSTANWLANFLVSHWFLTATNTYITYSAIGFFNLFSFWFIYKALPETKGRTLLEILVVLIPNKRRSFFERSMAGNS